MLSNAEIPLSVTPVIKPRTSKTVYVTGLSFATDASQSGSSSKGKRAGLSMNNGIPRKFIIPQNVSWDFAVAATITDIPEKPNENRITIAIMGAKTRGLGNETPIASAIPKIRLACKAAIREIASIFPKAMAERDIGDVKALFIKP